MMMMMMTHCCFGDGDKYNQQQVDVGRPWPSSTKTLRAACRASWQQRQARWQQCQPQTLSMAALLLTLLAAAASMKLLLTPV
jgi:hypothetical protein